MVYKRQDWSRKKATTKGTREKSRLWDDEGSKVRAWGGLLVLVSGLGAAEGRAQARNLAGQEVLGEWTLISGGQGAQTARAAKSRLDLFRPGLTEGEGNPNKGQDCSRQGPRYQTTNEPRHTLVTPRCQLLLCTNPHAILPEGKAHTAHLFFDPVKFHWRSSIT